MKKLFGLAFILTVVFLASCRKDDVIKQQGVNLRFSADTVFLDTVFSTVGSSTYLLKAYNDENEKVIVDEITLEDPGSYYRINVNGTTARGGIRDVEILPHDSIYIFIEVTPAVVGAPEMVYTDRLLFRNKGTEQDVELVTLARDAYFHYPTNFLVIGRSPNAIVIPYSILASRDTTWPNDKPHVIYGYGVVDEGATLNILPGTDVHFHSNSGMWVYNGARLNVGIGGSPSDSVTFMGDRLEPSYENYPGQWGGVLGGLFIDDSARARIQYTVIKNAVNAIRLDSAQFTSEADPQLKISNSYILNSSRTAIYGGFGCIFGENVVVANNGYYSLYAYGGNYYFRHSTFANYWSQSTRTVPAVLLTNYNVFLDEDEEEQTIVRPLQSADFGNCIIYGSSSQELQIEQDESDILEYEFRNVLLKLDRDEDDRGFDINNGRFFNPVVNFDPAFKDIGSNNYDLETESQAIDQGNSGMDFVPTDIRGRIRGDGNPDLGAYEFQ